MFWPKRKDPVPWQQIRHFLQRGHESTVSSQPGSKEAEASRLAKRWRPKHRTIFCNHCTYSTFFLHLFLHCLWGDIGSTDFHTDHSLAVFAATQSFSNFSMPSWLLQCVFFQLLFLGAWFSHAFGVPVSFLGFHFACLLFSDIGILSRRCSESFPSSTFQRSISTGRHIEFQWLSLSQNSLQLIDACVLGSCFEKLLR